MVMTMSTKAVMMMMMGADSRELDPSRPHKGVAGVGRGRCRRSGSSKKRANADVRAPSNHILAGVRSHARGIGLADHDGQANRVPSTLQEDVLLDLEAELLVVRVVGERAGFEVHGLVFGVGLDAHKQSLLTTPCLPSTMISPVRIYNRIGRLTL